MTISPVTDPFRFNLNTWAKRLRRRGSRLDPQVITRYVVIAKDLGLRMTRKNALAMVISGLPELSHLDDTRYVLSRVISEAIYLKLYTKHSEQNHIHLLVLAAGSDVPTCIILGDSLGIASDVIDRLERNRI